MFFNLFICLGCVAWFETQPSMHLQEGLSGIVLFLHMHFTNCVCQVLNVTTHVPKWQHLHCIFENKTHDLNIFWHMNSHEDEAMIDPTSCSACGLELLVKHSNVPQACQHACLCSLATAVTNVIDHVPSLHCCNNPSMFLAVCFWQMLTLQVMMCLMPHIFLLIPLSSTNVLMCGFHRKIKIPVSPSTQLKAAHTMHCHIAPCLDGNVKLDTAVKCATDA